MPSVKPLCDTSVADVYRGRMHPSPRGRMGSSLVDYDRAEDDVTDEELEGHLPLTPTTFYILVALARGPGHGYAVAKDVEKLSDRRIVMGPGTLYGSLQRMLGWGLIEEAPNPGESGLHSERRRYYRMTPLGIAALRAESERLLRAVTAARDRLGA